MNSIIHFDYFLGDTIAIEKQKNYFVINNKGELLFPVSDFGKRSEARNRLLVDLLARTDFMGKARTGIERVRPVRYKIYETMQLNSEELSNGVKMPAPEMVIMQSFRFTDAFWITIHSNQKDTDRVPDRVPDKVPDRAADHLTENQRALLNLIAQDSTVSMSKISEHIGISKRKVLDNINKLKAMGIVVRSGTKKGGHWEIIEK